MLTFEPPASEMVAGMVYASPLIKCSFDCLAEIKLNYRMKLISITEVQRLQDELNQHYKKYTLHLSTLVSNLLCMYIHNRKLAVEPEGLPVLAVEVMERGDHLDASFGKTFESFSV